MSVGKHAIAFRSLRQEHFPLLLNWLEAPHVKAWWDRDVSWTLEQIQKKYFSRVLSQKDGDADPKTVYAYVFEVDTVPVGYCQHYNAHEFDAGRFLPVFSKSLAGIDFFVGDENFLRKGIARRVLKEFLEKIVDLKYENTLVTPEKNNEAAVKFYEKAGFQKRICVLETNEVWMIRARQGRHFSHTYDDIKQQTTS